MQKRFVRSFKYSIFVVILILYFSSALTTVYGQEFAGQGKLKERLAKRGIDLSKLRERIQEVIRVQDRYKDFLMEKSDVVGTGAGISSEGEAVIKVFTSRAGTGGIPRRLDGVGVRIKVTGRFHALREDTCGASGDGVCERWERWPFPVPIGVSTGHPNITAGTIGARVKDSAGNVYALSNNHVYADINNASLGDDILQPGSVDGGDSQLDVIGTLSDYEIIKFCQPFFFWFICSETNTIDAAIALSTDSQLGFETPMGEFGSSPGYGAPSSSIHAAYGDPDLLGDEVLSQLVGLSVKKYGRTTGLTYGTIDAVNATIDVGYGSNIGRFVDQIVVASTDAFIQGGDSGSLMVTDPDGNPVGLLYAGNSSGTSALANRIDLVLDRFQVVIDSGAPPSLETISVIPGSGTIGIEETEQFTATGYYSDGSESDLTDSASWDSSDPFVASIDYGMATGLSEGTTYITATQDGIDSSPATLNVTATPPTLEYITVTPVDAAIEVDGTQQFTATGLYSDGSESVLTSTAEWRSQDPDIATIEPGGLATGVSEGTARIIATYNDITSVPVNLEVIVPLGIKFETGTVTANTASWTTVVLSHDYGQDMVVICTPNYEYDALLTPEPLVVHVRNANDSSFQVKLVQAVGGSLQDVSAEVHYMVIKQGVYTLDQHGVKMEAFKFNSTVTDGSGSWVGQSRSYANSYSNPVVVGQVMTYNADRAWYWSVFWSRGSSRRNPPSSSELWIGKHKGQDPREVNNETIGYVVIETGEGTIGTTNYYAFLGPDTVTGTYNASPYTYSLNDLSFTPATAILSQAAMDGGDGGWAVLYGGDPVTSGFLELVIEEDMVWDSERRHTTEQVGCIVFEQQE
jgi:hypothetical protein